MMRSTSGIQYSGGGIGLKSSGVLAQSGVASSVTGTTSETTLATVSIPANAMGANGRLVVETLWSMPNNANAKTFFVRIGATAFLGWGATTSNTFRARTVIQNAGAQNSQVFPATGGSASYSEALNGNAFATASIDFTSAQTISINGQLGVGTDTITLLGYSVQVLNP